MPKAQAIEGIMRTSCLALLFVVFPAAAHGDSPQYPPPADVKATFLKLQDRPKVPADVKAIENRLDPDGLLTEKLTFVSEKKADGTVERVPLLIVRPGSGGKRSAVIVLHGTGGSKEGVKPWLVELAKRGFVAAAIDARYHGDRSGGAKGAAAYNQAIVRAWKAKPNEKQEHPFYYDTVWDLWRTVDYLQTRHDVDPKKIGMIGISMGGIQTWLAAAVDDRVGVAVPAIGVQSFRWSLENDNWQGRANTIKAAHDAAANDLGEPAVNKEVCRALWNKVIPGMLDQFDCPSMLRLFAGRPLLILNGELDGNCPLGGAKLAFAEAEKAFAAAKASDKLKILLAEGVGHKVTPEQHRAALEWFEKWLK
jgi:dienelactone hydrolase